MILHSTWYARVPCKQSFFLKLYHMTNNRVLFFFFLSFCRCLCIYTYAQRHNSRRVIRAHADIHTYTTLPYTHSHTLKLSNSQTLCTFAFYFPVRFDFLVLLWGGGEGNEEFLKKKSKTGVEGIKEREFDLNGFIEGI